jgi:NAD(P)-dependent dehydrogenase (short-subunit alcohol dehydrogenase family)
MVSAMKGKVALVTGASAGIGKVTARELARMGATVVVVCRDATRGEAALSEIRKESGSEDVSLMLCDFASQRSIRAFAAAFKAKHPKLHVLVNNAGAIQGERVVTEDGLEATFAVNHVGYFLLTDLLLDILKASAPSRIVSVASAAHKGAKLDLEDLAAEKSWSSFGAYGASKLANIAFTAELARRLEGTGVTANCLHPGVVATNFGSSGGFFLRIGVKLARPFFITSESGAATTIYLATSPEVEGVSGKYFDKKTAVTPSKLARDADFATALWAKTEAIVRKSAAETPVIAAAG